MSFEGYYQVLCKNGHLDCVDAYIFQSCKWECSVCKESEELAWLNMVDVTNGSYDDDGNRIDGWVELQIKDHEKKCECSECGNVHVSQHETYLAPAPNEFICSETEDNDNDDDYDYEENLGI